MFYLEFAMTGYRVGWARAAPHIITQLTKLQEPLLSCGVPFCHAGALEALTNPMSKVVLFSIALICIYLFFIVLYLSIILIVNGCVRFIHCCCSFSCALSLASSYCVHYFYDVFCIL